MVGRWWKHIHLRSFNENDKIYTPTMINEEMDIKEVMEDKLKGCCWESFKHTNEVKAATTNAASTNYTLKTYLTQYLSHTANCKNIFALHCLFNTLNYYLLISKIRIRSKVDHDVRYKMLNEVRNALSVNLSGTKQS